MITFAGIPINQVAPVMIEDIKVSPISLNPVVRPRAIKFGSQFVRMGGGERTVTVTFALLDKNPVTRHESLMNLSKWARTDGEFKLLLPQDPMRFLQCVCSSKWEASTRAWWENKLKLTFTCYTNPYWTDIQTKSVACGTQFTVLGDAPPLMHITRTISSTVSSPSYSDSVNTLSFNSLAAGNLDIDLNNQTISLSGVSVVANLYSSSNFIVPRTGTMTITGTGTVTYQERWE